METTQTHEVTIMQWASEHGLTKQQARRQLLAMVRRGEATVRIGRVREDRIPREDYTPGAGSSRKWNPPCNYYTVEAT